MALENCEQSIFTCMHVLLGLLGLRASNPGKETAKTAVVFLTGLVQLLPDELQLKVYHNIVYRL